MEQEKVEKGDKKQKKTKAAKIEQSKARGYSDGRHA